MRTWRVAFACIAALGAGAVANAGEIVIPANVESIIQTEAARPPQQRVLDKAQMEQSRTQMRTWVSRSMDLGQAVRRTSTRFDRTSYVQQSSADTLRLPTERLGAAQEQAPTARWLPAGPHGPQPSRRRSRGGRSSIPRCNSTQRR